MSARVDKWNELLMSMNTPPAEDLSYSVKYRFTLQGQSGAGEASIVFPHPLEEISGDVGGFQSKDKSRVGFSALLLGFGALGLGCLYLGGKVLQSRLIQLGKQVRHSVVSPHESEGSNGR